MGMLFRQLRSGERCEVDGRGPGLTVTLGCGRGSSVAISADQSLLVCLRGELHAETSDGAADLASGRILMGTTGRLRAVARHSALWLGVSGSTAAWREALLDVVPTAEEREPIFYPHAGPCPVSLKRALVRMARHLRRKDPDEDRWLVDEALAQMWDAQRDIDDLSNLCAGKSSARRRQNLLRLIRVRHWIVMNPAASIQLSALAASASYSPWHFIRSFRDVFGEAPREYAIRVRLEHARRLIDTSGLSITEVAGAVGYDSRSAFCRSFRQAYGMSASEARRLSREASAI